MKLLWDRPGLALSTSGPTAEYQTVSGPKEHSSLSRGLADSHPVRLEGNGLISAVAAGPFSLVVRLRSLIERDVFFFSFHLKIFSLVYVLHTLQKLKQIN